MLSYNVLTVVEAVTLVSFVAVMPETPPVSLLLFQKQASANGDGDSTMGGQCHHPFSSTSYLGKLVSDRVKL